MSILSPLPLRRASALAAGAAVLLGSVFPGPTATADDLDSTATADIDIVLHEDNIADMTVVYDLDDLYLDLICKDDLWEEENADKVTVSRNDDTCTLRIVGYRFMEDDSDGNLTITHTDGEYIVEATADAFSEYDEASLAVTFPGKVTRADDNAKISGNQVSWDDVVTLSSIRAAGKDSPGSGILPWIIIGVVVLAAIVGGVIAVVVSRNRKRFNPAAGYPGAQPQYGQPAYGAPQQPGYQPQPGQPGYGVTQQPGAQPQPGQPDYSAQPQQPGYQQPGQNQPPYNPGGQY
ncbi:hypothetical protein [Actinomyces sp.]|uniref:LppM family (lipo)protein n=1 Tax=Actinomyces sp. TaxID=29317 RepID=UPI0026DD5031|nr:hypothetical protein [Actinomyces sp.]MDO4900932.1 hypothetical protein [Actinomyces sp.]